MAHALFKNSGDWIRKIWSGSCARNHGVNA